jgi:hypothetical protein
MKTKAKSKQVKSGSNKKQRQKKIIATAIAVGAAGILGYFGWQYLKKRKGSKGSDLDEALRPFPTSSTANTDEAPATSNIFIPKPAQASATSKPKAANTSGFPLKKKSKGEKVRQLQEALIAKHGPSILPKYGADGDFGTETANALKKLGLPQSIDQNTFNVLVEGTTAAADPAASGKELFTAASANDFNRVLIILKKIQDTQDYTAANEVFKTFRLNGGVRQTIVNGLLSVFKKTDQKEKIKYEFLRMGLQYDGSKWSLSGLDGGLPVVTILPTTVWLDANRGVKVPARMVLGNEVCRRLDYTLFQNKGKYFLVQTRCIKPL